MLLGTSIRRARRRPRQGYAEGVPLGREAWAAVARTALQAGPVAVLVLGGAHDLSGAVRRLAPGDCEYLRVTPARYAEFAEGGSR
jgi:hypothetical protein